MIKCANMLLRGVTWPTAQTRTHWARCVRPACKETISKSYLFVGVLQHERSASTHICTAGVKQRISAPWARSFEQWSPLGDGDVHKCSPTHLIGLKCPFKLNSRGVQITTSPTSAEPRILVLCDSQHALGSGSKKLKQMFPFFKKGSHWKPLRQTAGRAMIVMPTEMHREGSGSHFTRVLCCSSCRLLPPGYCCWHYYRVPLNAARQLHFG